MFAIIPSRLLILYFCYIGKFYQEIGFMKQNVHHRNFYQLPGFLPAFDKVIRMDEQLTEKVLVPKISGYFDFDCDAFRVRDIQTGSLQFFSVLCTSLLIGEKLTNKPMTG